jgi:multicomponent K+:H+ antiporter subunit D
MMGNLIILPVVLPAVLAGLTVLLARDNLRLQRVVGSVGVLVFAALALWLLLHSNAPQAYRLGNWPAPFGIVLMLDRLSALMLALLGAVALPVLVYAIATGWDARGRHFHALFLFQLMGLSGAFLTADAFNLFVFFEVLLIASYGLMVHGGGDARLRAGLHYVVTNLVGSTLFLFALATIYGVTGTLNMADLAQKWPLLPPGDQALARVAAGLLLLVFAVKGALVPLQFWLPGTYANAPGPVAALFAIMTKVGAYATLRLGTLVFDQGPTAGMWASLLWPAALLTLALGAFGALGARGLSRLVAFTAIGSMGTVFLALSAGTVQATTAGLYYMIHSTLAGAALFLLADLVLSRRGSDRLDEARAIAQSGLIGALFIAAAVAMAGLPPLSGFLGKLLVLNALPFVLGWVTILIASFLTLLALARAGSALFWKGSGHPPARHPSQPMAFAAIGTLLAGLVALTLCAGPVTAWLSETAQDLHAPAAYIAATDLQKGN